MPHGIRLEIGVYLNYISSSKRKSQNMEIMEGLELLDEKSAIA